jgi:hypothetical protein
MIAGIFIVLIMLALTMGWFAGWLQDRAMWRDPSRAYVHSLSGLYGDPRWEATAEDIAKLWRIWRTRARFDP